MTTRWMDRMHALVPMTEQEEQVDDILNQYAIEHHRNVVFPVAGRTYVVDFYIPSSSVALEVWKSSSRRGVALVWVERNAAYIDLKFKRIKAAYPGTRSMALVEVDQAEPSLVRKYVAPVLEHADAVCCSKDEFSTEIRKLQGAI